MSDQENNALPLALDAASVAPRARKSVYPDPFAERVSGRIKRVLGDAFGLKNFGVNLTRLEPGAQSSLMHRHGVQDEFIYVLEGTATLVTEDDEVQLQPGMCAGFAAGGVAHHLINRTQEPVVYLEIGDRSPGDSAQYPQDDLQAVQTPEGRWKFLHKDGRPYE
ncbi:MAG: cupin domain-containing protein [Neomegalonema sp.]|nr:cupin domain-containing protein [Neomegalonema sp.]